MKVIWSEQALLDVEHIRDYIARDSPAYALPFIERLLQASNTTFARVSAKWQADAGSQEPQHPRGDLSGLSYRVPAVPGTIEIVMVAHGSRDLGNPGNDSWENQ